MAQVVDWRDPKDRLDAVRRAVCTLRQDGLVAFPTETVYGLGALLRDSSCRRLVECKGRPETKPLAVALPDPEDCLAWSPGLGRVGRRLARRCWPGPVTLVLDVDLECEPGAGLQPPLRTRICPEGSVGFRVPAHEAVREVLLELGEPLALTSANPTGGADSSTGQQVIDALGGRIDLIIDDGPCRYGQPSTVVRVQGDSWKVLREGVVPAGQIANLTATVLLFVCTGNTCRSPLAEGLCKKLLAARLGCLAEELPQRGFVVLSAGLSAMMGDGAAEEAIEAAQLRGVDLRGHQTRPLTRELVQKADFVFTMTQSHLRAVEAFFPARLGRVELLSPQGEDVADPIGGDQQVYEECTGQILRCLEERLAEIQAG